MIPVLPNGDCSFFLAPDLEWGWFGHPWEQTVCVFGEPLLAAAPFAVHDDSQKGMSDSTQSWSKPS